MSSDGSHVVVTEGDHVRIAGGPVLIEAAQVAAAASVDGATWIVTEAPGGHQMHRFDRCGARIGTPAGLGALGDDLVIATLRVGGRGALVEGDRAVMVTERDGQLAVEPLGDRGRDRRVLIGGRGVMERRGPLLAWLRRGAMPGFALPFDLTGASVVSGTMVLDGAAALVELDRNGQRVALVYDVRRGEVRSRIRLGEAAIVAVAERKGVIVLGRGASLAMFDLRAGCCVGERLLPGMLAACAIDGQASRLVIIDQHGEVAELGAAMTNALVAVPAGARTARAISNTATAGMDESNVTLGDAIISSTAARTSQRAITGVAVANSAISDNAAAGAAQLAITGVTIADSVILDTAIRITQLAPTDVTVADSVISNTAADRIAQLAPTDVTAADSTISKSSTARIAQVATTDVTVADSIISNRAAQLGAAGADSIRSSTAAAPAPTDALTAASRLVLTALEPAAPHALAPDLLDYYLADLRAWVESLCGAAQAAADGAGDAAQAARERARAATEQLASWGHGPAPHRELADELGLSPTALTALILIAAPQIWGELARSYGRCVGDAARPLVDELLLAHLLDAGTADRLALGREFDAGAPLIASGAVELGRGLRPYAALSAHPAIARRLAGGGRTTLDRTAPALHAICGPRDAIAALARRLAAPAVQGTGGIAPRARVVLRGRPGSGRRSLAAALAAQAGRRAGHVAIADAVQAAELEAVVRRRLCDVALRGELPCVDLEGVADEPGLHARIRGVLDAHPGPLIVRAACHGELPLAPGYAALELPALSETARVAIWRDLLAARGHAPAITAAVAASLAARFLVGPGAMIRACAELDAMPPAGRSSSARQPDTTACTTTTTDAITTIEHALAGVLRQHRSARIEAVASRVETLAGWDELVVPDDIADALREVCARVRHRRLVLEGWGMERAAATAQGVTALFQGGPGTGKTMAAGVIARALGYELWRVDLSKVVSKWIGETEKNLAAVFDAAEQGEIVLLFDEADSLFAKRTQVASSNDRNANLETNYLLQRLDSFTGIAVLTTNAGTAIDAAFKRRMSVHVQFPFPDEADRERLWRAHLPPSLPIAGALELGALAHKHALSGGYIRNACLRAAYLAAADGGPLTERHLQRAVTLEYQRAGKLAGGRLE